MTESAVVSGPERVFQIACVCYRALSGSASASACPAGNTRTDSIWANRANSLSR